ncbi:MAG: mechanosensitive ion channel domain-containing protein [Pseudomonadota bacterium]
MRTWLRLLMVVCLCLWAGVGATQDAPLSPAEMLAQMGEGADEIEAAISAGELSEARIKYLLAELEGGRQAMFNIGSNAETQLAPLLAQLRALGDPPEEGTEPEGIAAVRARLNASIDEIGTVARRAEQGQARVVALIDRLNKLRLERFREVLLRRGPSPLLPERVENTVIAAIGLYEQMKFEMQVRLASDDAMLSLVDRLALPVVLALLALFVGVWVRRWLVRRLQRAVTPDATRGTLVGVAAGITFARLLLPAAAILLVVQGLIYSGLAGPTAELFLRATTAGALIVVAAFALGGTYFAPGTGDIRLSTLDDRGARNAQRWLVALAIVVALDRMLVEAGETAGVLIDALAVTNAAILILGGIALWRFAQASNLGKAPVEEDEDVSALEDPDESPTPGALPISIAMRILRVSVRVVAVAAPMLALAGYYGASRFVFYPLLYSGALIGLCVLIYQVVRETTSALRGDPKVRAPGETRGLGVAPVLTAFILSIAAMPVLALIWGATPTDLGAAWSRMIEGFPVGETVVSPVDFVMFIIVFVIGYMLTKGLQGVMRRSVLPLTRLDTGARSAIVSGLGYVGVAIAALISISTTGVDLSNLAIVAGALSVGIGFGLQNIVNNFVSGIILLIERPIKVGDWVEIAGVHGTVQQVNVRSTEIQTFDRSSMFVPNADLIAGTVTNWTHSNNHGRIIVGVSVAYGTDAREVEKVLLEVAQNHPMLMRRPAPYVIFTNFGADGLDFEIRGVLRDVNWILNVGSDLRFEIYKRLGEVGVEIPFAQRDIHIKNASELGAALRGEPVKADEPPQVSDDTPVAPPPRGEGPDADGDGDGGVR